MPKCFALHRIGLGILLSAALAPAAMAEEMRPEPRPGTGKTLSTEIAVGKAPDGKPVPSSRMSEVDEETTRLVHERWKHLYKTMNRSHRFNPMPVEVPPEQIRPWTPPTDSGVRRGTDPIRLEVNGTPSTVTASASAVVNEPSVAAVDDRVFYTANWFAAESVDGGDTWTYVNPYTGPFPEPAGQTFCCDQQVHHDRTSNALFWLQQLIPDTSTDEGSQRINVDQDSNGTWDCFYDVTPQDAGFADNTFPDYPDFSVSNGHLFVTSNIFGSGGGGFHGAFVARLPLADITACNKTTVDFHTETTFGSFRTTQGAGDTMYFADVVSQTSIRIWTWPDAASAPTTVARTINAFLSGTRTCTDPGGRNWCQSIDGRIMGGAVAGNRVAFLWVAQQNPGGGFPFPYSQGVILNAADNLQVLEQPLIWSNDAAWVYPSLATNANGDFGGTVMWGGGTFYPQCSAFLVDDANGDSFSPLEHELVIAGTTSSTVNRSGDYLATRVFPSNDEVYAGTCFSYTTPGDAESRYVLFGRQSDFSTSEIFVDGFESGDTSAW